jgi:hypothetical protein
MNKDIFSYILVFVVLFLIGFYLHQSILSYQEIEMSFSLEKTYFFHAFFSSMVCINLRIVSSVEKLYPQVGFIYLASLGIKLILFVILFYNPIFTAESFHFVEKISLIVPSVIFLVAEAIFAIKILNTNQ